MIEIDKPNIEIVDLSTQGSRSVGRFVVEPLERGFGTTLGNSMRRVLLSSLPGYAITSVKIDGVLHEFSTIPHVKEDVTEIVLNLKNVVLKINDESQKTLYIKASGEGEITAGDIEHSSDVEILNPDLHIAYLDEGAEVIMAPERVVTDGNITTSRGMGTSIDLGLELVRLIKGQELSDKLRKSTQYV